MGSLFQHGNRCDRAAAMGRIPVFRPEFPCQLVTLTRWRARAGCTQQDAGRGRVQADVRLPLHHRAGPVVAGPYLRMTERIRGQAPDDAGDVTELAIR